MLAITLTAPPQSAQVKISIFNTRFNRCAHVIETWRAGGAKALFAGASAVCNFEVGLDCSGADGQAVLAREDDDAKGRTRQRLAICAMADHDSFGLDIRYKGNLTAMTGAVDFHSACSPAAAGQMIELPDSWNSGNTVTLTTLPRAMP